MPEWLQIIIAVVGSSGIWTFLSTWMQKKSEKKSLANRMLLGLGHDRIIWLCEKYIERGYITKGEFENLHDYLYVPYKEMGGNGTAERLMKEVEKLPIRKDNPILEDHQIKMSI